MGLLQRIFGGTLSRTKAGSIHDEFDRAAFGAQMVIFQAKYKGILYASVKSIADDVSKADLILNRRVGQEEVQVQQAVASAQVVRVRIPDDYHPLLRDSSAFIVILNPC